jgi:hypothetical protein
VSIGLEEDFLISNGCFNRAAIGRLHLGQHAELFAEQRREACQRRTAGISLSHCVGGRDPALKRS